MISIRQTVLLMALMFILGLLAGLCINQMEMPKPTAKRPIPPQIKTEEHPVIQEPVIISEPKVVIFKEVPLENAPIHADNRSVENSAPLLFSLAQAKEMMKERGWNAVWTSTQLAALEVPLKEDFVTIRFRCWKMVEGRREIFYPDEVRYSGVGVSTDPGQQVIKMEPQGLLLFDLYFKEADLLASKMAKGLHIQVVWDRDFDGEHQSLILDHHSVDPTRGWYAISWSDFLTGTSPTYDWEH